MRWELYPSKSELLGATISVASPENVAVGKDNADVEESSIVVDRDILKKRDDGQGWVLEGTRPAAKITSTAVYHKTWTQHLSCFPEHTKTAINLNAAIVIVELVKTRMGKVWFL